MDVDTLINALTDDERTELTERLTSAADGAQPADGDSDSGCCGGGRSSKRREKMQHKREMCCAS
jgi:heterodisulfide reductase subunit B